MTTALPFLMISLGAMCITGLILVLLLKRRLKREYQDIYARLNSSTFPIANDLRFARFLLSGSYAVSVGSDMKRRMDAIRLFVIAYLVVFGATLLAFALS